VDTPLTYTAPRFIHTFTRFCQGALGTSGALTLASAAWPTANLAYYVPLTLPFSFNARRFFWVNGGTLGDNVDIGIYSKDGALIYSAGSQAQSGGTINLPFYTTISPDLVLAPGAYYLALAVSGTTATFQRVNTGVIQMRAGGSLQQTSAFALPATMTPAVVATNSFYALFGITSTTTGF
jgi:hypothetical protein